MHESEPDGLRVLVVDDNDINLEVTVDMLEFLGHHADVASNGRRALASFDPALHDLILMDCQMPVMDGYEAATELRRRFAGSDHRVPIVALTAHALQGDQAKCLAAGMDDYVTKPLTIATLREAIERWRQSRL
jgi:CheY-like chemotaxis protein